jgi:hypothetical protein
MAKATIHGPQTSVQANVVTQKKLKELIADPQRDRKERATELRTLRDKIMALKELSLQHVCLDGYDTIVSHWTDETTKTIPVFLTKDRRAFLNALDVTEKVDHKVSHITLSTGNSRINLIVAEAGKNFLPTRLEAECLSISGKVVHRDCLYVPTSDNLFWVMLYRMLAHQGRFTLPEQQLIVPKIATRFGMLLKSEYVDVPHEIKVTESKII